MENVKKFDVFNEMVKTKEAKEASDNKEAIKNIETLIDRLNEMKKNLKKGKENVILVNKINKFCKEFMREPLKSKFNLKEENPSYGME